METIIIRDLFPAISNGQGIEKHIDYLNQAILVQDVQGSTSSIAGFIQIYKDWFEKFCMERIITDYAVLGSVMVIEWEGCLHIKQKKLKTQLKTQEINFNGITKFRYCEKKINEIITYSNFNESFHMIWQRSVVEKNNKESIPSCANIEYLFENFSQRELDVLRLLVNGYSFKEAAGQLQISPRTVETYINNIYLKTGAVHKSGLFKKLKEKELWQYLVGG